jgi:phosphopantothenoylcysteine synthetase/decarboxylase
VRAGAPADEEGRRRPGGDDPQRPRVRHADDLPGADRQPVLTDLFDLGQDQTFGHLETARAADLFLVAPATANLIARIRAGMADDPVTTSLLASRCPVLLARR